MLGELVTTNVGGGTIKVATLASRTAAQARGLGSAAFREVNVNPFKQSGSRRGKVVEVLTLSAVLVFRTGMTVFSSAYRLAAKSWSIFL